MRQLRRPILSQDVRNHLAQLTDRVRQAVDDQAKAKALWKNKNKTTFGKIRKILKEMASGLERCMYCEDSHGTDIEHFWPKSKYPARAFDWLNYLLACSTCNSNFKRTQFPLDGNDAPLLIDPSVDDPHDHLQLSPSTGKYVSVGDKGDQSIIVYGLDRYLLEQARCDAWVSIQLHIEAYDDAVSAGDQALANRLQAVTCNLQQSGVLIELLHVANGHHGHNLLRPRCLAAIQSRPEIQTWLH
jgi:uncharacterized protein (TIGR02646 family)